MLKTKQNKKKKKKKKHIHNEQVIFHCSGAFYGALILIVIDGIPCV